MRFYRDVNPVYLQSTKSTYQLFNSLSDAVFVYEPTGILEFINDKGNGLLAECDGVTISSFFELFTVDKRKILDEHRILYEENDPGKSVICESVIIISESCHFAVSITTKLLAIDSHTLFLSTLRILSRSASAYSEEKRYADKYQFVLDALPSMIWITNKENKLIFINRSLRQQIGLAPEIFASQIDSRNWIHPDDQKSTYRLLCRSVINRTSYKREFRMLTANGQYKWVLEEAGPQYAEGQYLGFTGIYTDIDTIKKIQEELHEAKSNIDFLMNKTSVFVYKHSLEGTVSEISKACTKILGYAPEEIVDRNIATLIHPSDYKKKFVSGSFKKAMKEHTPLIYRFLTKNGDWKWIEIQGAFYSDRNGNVAGVICMARDISKKVQLEKENSLSEKLLQYTNSLIVLYNCKKTIVWANEAFCRTSGYSLEELKGNFAADLLYGEGTDLEMVKYMEEHLQKKEAFSCELLNYRKNKSPYWVSIFCEPVYNSVGELENFILIQEDISERKKYENEILVAASFPQYSPNPVMRINKERAILFQNEAAMKITKVFYNGCYYSLEEFAEYLLNEFSNKRYFLTPVESNKRIYELRGLEVNNTDLYNIYLTDITELNHATMMLQSSERKFRFLAENSKDIICLHNVFDQLLYVSPSSEKMLGFTPEELAGQKIASICHPSDKEKLNKSFQKVLEQPETIITNEIRLQKKNGLYTWMEIQFYALLEDGEIAGIQTSSRDISHQKTQEFRLKANELKYRRLIDNMDLGYLEVDTEGKITFTNESFCRMTRFSESELIGENPEHLILVSPEHKEEMSERNKHRQQAIAEVYQMQICRKDGVIRTLLISGAPLVSEEGTVIGSAGIHWDITPLLEMEIRLHEKEVQRQRNILQASIRSEEKQKQTLGRELHDGLGQLLAFISINMQLLLDKGVPADEIVRSSKEHINNAITEIRQLSRTLIPVALDTTKSLKAIISESLVLFANLKGLRFDIDSYDFSIDRKLSIDQKHIVFRILQELTNNTIKYANATQIKISMKLKPHQCHIEYNDNGIGFNLSKITRGVGFESIQTRIESCNGKLQFQSRPGKGMKAVFTIPYTVVAVPESN